MLRRLHARLHDERGIVLIMAVGISITLALTATAVVSYSSSNSRSASIDRTGLNTRALAEAGINNAMAVLANPANNALNPALLPERTTAYAGGTVTWSGVLDQTLGIWTVTSTGRAPNPAAAGAFLERTLRAKVPVYPTFNQPLNNPAWNYIYSRGTGSTCDMSIGQSVVVRSPLYVDGNLCLSNQARIARGPLIVHGGVTMNQTANAIGSAEVPINSAEVKNGCKWTGNPLHNPCRYGAGNAGNSNVWANTITNNPGAITMPTALFDEWYLNANPGPHFPCTTQSGTVPVFDNDAANPPSTTRRNNSVGTVFHLTPGASYTCQTFAGELSWNATTRVLTVKGTIYIDGSIRIENGQVNSYDGHSTIYVTGTVLIKNSKMCVVISGSNCTTSGWNPNARMLVLVAAGKGGQVPADTGIQLVSAHFQGALFATHAIDITTTSLADGPLNGEPVKLGQSSNSDFPGFTIVPVGMPGNPAVYAQPGTPEMDG